MLSFSATYFPVFPAVVSKKTPRLISLRTLFLVLCLWLGALVAATAYADERLDINQADAPAIAAAMTGIGETKARAIVAYREANGPFASVDELLQVKGIGEKTLANNRDRIQVGSAMPDTASAKP